MKRIIISAALMCGLTTSAMAYDFSDTIAGKAIYYNIIDSVALKVEVTYNAFNDYGGKIEQGVIVNGGVQIPNKVVANGKTYSVTKIGNKAFYNCTLMDALTIPNSIIEIGTEAFTFCNNLKTFIVPDSVYTIGDRAFSYCASLEWITIGKRVHSIGENAFDLCLKLKTVVSHAVTPPTIDTSTFYVADSVKIYDSVTLKVPANSINSYRNAPFWKYFLKIEVGLSSVEAAAEINIYPNPTSDVLNVISPLKVKYIDIYNVSGAKVKSMTINNYESKININDLKAGNYIVNLVTEKGTLTKKIVVK